MHYYEKPLASENFRLKIYFGKLKFFEFGKIGFKIKNKKINKINITGS